MRKFLFPVLFLFLLSACKSNNKKAFEFSESMTAISATLQSKGKEFGTELQPAMQSNDYSKLAAISSSLDEFISGKLAELKSKKDFSGSEKFRTSMIDFLDFEKQMIQEAFVPFGKLNASSTEEEKQAVIQNLMKLTEGEGKYLLKVQEAQKEFAAKNGFRVEEKKSY